MNFTEAFDLVDAAIFSKTGKHLSDPEVTVLQGAWEGLTYDKMANASEYTLNYLMRDVGPNLWKTLSMTLGEEVSKTNFRAALERQRRSLLPYRPSSRAMSLVTPEPTQEEEELPRRDWGEAIDVSVFYGRQEELATLKHWVVEERCKLITIAGLPEMGKSALATKLAETVQDEFDYVIWRSMRRFSADAIASTSIPSSTSPLTLLIAELIQFLSHRTETRLPETVDQQISLLLHYLRSYRCLIVLDGLEKVLHSRGLPTQHQDKGRYEPGYEELGTLLTRIAQEQHSSCLILTTQKKPLQVADLAGENRPIRDFKLSGLHSEAAKELFKEKDINIEENVDSLASLIDKYEGHYSVLNRTAYYIKEVFDGNVKSFVDSTEGKGLTTEYSEFVKESYERLSEQEIKVLEYIASQDKAVSLADLQEDLSISILELISVLSSLNSYSLINKLKATESSNSSPRYELPYLVKRYVNSQKDEKKMVRT